MSSNNSLSASNSTLWGGLAKHNQRQLATNGHPYDRELVAAIMKGDMNIIQSIEAGNYDQDNELSFKQYSNLDHHFGVNILQNPLLLAARVVEFNTSPEKEAVLMHLASSKLVTEEQRQAVNATLTENSAARSLIQAQLSPSMTSPAMGS